MNKMQLSFDFFAFPAVLFYSVPRDNLGSSALPFNSRSTAVKNNKNDSVVVCFNSVKMAIEEKKDDKILKLFDAYAEKIHW